jgi:ATP-dependent HslUV protease ATP-binding subunit HslU
MEELTPREIVAELDKYIVGQAEAKRCVAIAVRNRWRRLRLDEEMAREVTPKNIIMIGPTGVGKTEIARRLAGLVRAPFLKVEASRYTEVGYHGRDVETMVRDLAEIGVGMVRSERFETVRGQAEERAEEKLLDLLLPLDAAALDADAERAERTQAGRERFRRQLRDGQLEDSEVEITVEEKPVVMSAVGADELGVDLQGFMERMMPSRTRTRRVRVREARRILIQQAAESMIDQESIAEEAVRRVENSGIIFIDEIDKIASSVKNVSGPDVSREGVQRDLLPIIEGATVNTRYGHVRTDHILFVAAGAFTVSKPSDLIPELQGRFPIRVELDSLGKDDFVRILTEPKNALTRQYAALLDTEGVRVEFRPDAVDRLADIAAAANHSMQNIGARRLHTVMEKLLEDVAFHAPDMRGQTVPVTAAYVDQRLADIIKDEDLSRYVL